MTAATPLSQRLAHATRAMHQRAEKSGIMPALLRGQLGRDPYALLLRNLQALYIALESALDHNAVSPFVAPIRMPALYRAGTLHDDLDSLQGPHRAELPLTASMARYVEHIDELSRSRPELLAAHAYVRYMGDLSGGQILRSIVARSLGLPEGAGTAFYVFAGATDIAATKANFRAAINALPLDAAGATALTDEAIEAFGRHVEVFEEIAAIAQGAARR